MSRFLGTVLLALIVFVGAKIFGDYRYPTIDTDNQQRPGDSVVSPPVSDGELRDLCGQLRIALRDQGKDMKECAGIPQ